MMWLALLLACSALALAVHVRREDSLIMGLAAIPAALVVGLAGWAWERVRPLAREPELAPYGRVASAADLKSHVPVDTRPIDQQRRA